MRKHLGLLFLLACASIAPGCSGGDDDDGTSFAVVIDSEPFDVATSSSSLIAVFADVGDGEVPISMLGGTDYGVACGSDDVNVLDVGMWTDGCIAYGIMDGTTILRAVLVDESTLEELATDSVAATVLPP